MSETEKRDLSYNPKETKITLDKERTFRLDLNAYSELDSLHEEKGKTFHHVEADLLKMRPYAVRDFLWAGLIHEDSELTPAQVGKFVDVSNIEQYMRVILNTIMHENKAAEEKKEAETNSESVKE